MTLRERAEKIVGRFMTFSNSTDCISFAESELKAACEQQKIADGESIQQLVKAAVDEATKDRYPKWEVEAEKRDAINTALEKAAQLVDGWNMERGDCAKAIRALKNEGTGASSDNLKGGGA